ncbi:MAG: hypothetical protein IKY52_05195 [Clostridia bacterium]|nr:hypothetical protein [Clostridia bacterium]
MRKTLLSLLLAVGLLAGGFSGCGKKETLPEGDPVEKPTVLTHVYKGADLDL